MILTKQTAKGNINGRSGKHKEEEKENQKRNVGKDEE